MADIAAKFGRWAKSGLSALLWQSSSAWISSHSANEPSSSSTAAARLSAMEDMQRIMRMLPRIEAVLTDAEEREIKDRSVKLWLAELRLLSCDAEDVVDEYEYELLRAEVEDEAPAEVSRKRKRKEEGCNLFLSSQLPTISYDMAENLRGVRERFEEIERDREALRLRADDGVRRTDATPSPPPTSSHVDESSILGREIDKEKIVELLLSESKTSSQDSKKLVVIPIVGMGGLGKTTLAQLVYNDPRIRQHFDLQGWVCVSEEFDVVRLTEEIYKSLTKKPCEDDIGLSNLQDLLKKELLRERTFLVLDDVWNEKQSLWELLRAPLIGAGIVKILMTTRSEKVADVMRTVNSFCVGFLPKEQGWLLFRQRAFGDDDGHHQNLVKIGEKIVAKCGGLPLAIKLIGSQLRFERDEDRWMDVLESQLWEFDRGANEILPALRLSYQRMPAHLKPCFRYCSLFPKDMVLKRNRLVWLWMAQGYIQHKTIGRTTEDIGKEYFDELLGRSFFQAAKPRDDSFVMHDLLVDLAIYISNEDTAVMKLENGKQNCSLSYTVRHLAMHDLTSYQAIMQGTSVEPFLSGQSSLRSVFCYGNRITSDLQLAKVMYIRALHINILEAYKMLIPDLIASLKHLRYLHITVRLPSYSERKHTARLFCSVCHMYNLQTLDFSDYNSPIVLPGGIDNLINLRHLLLPKNSYMPRGIGKLTALQTLKSVVTMDGSNWCSRVSELKHLKSLTGKCCISEIRNATDFEDVKEAILKSKQHIRRLCLSWNLNEGLDADIFLVLKAKHNIELDADHYHEFAEAVLEALQPNTNLRELDVHDYPGVQFPLWLGNPSYSKLTHITIWGCGDACKSLPPLGQLPSLRSLNLCSVHGVRRIGREFLFQDVCARTDAMIGFPSLEKLCFSSMHEWKEWCEVLDIDLSCLQSLSIVNCAKLKKIEKLPSCLRSLFVHRCPMLTTLPGLNRMHQLKNLDIKKCQQLVIPARESFASQMQHTLDIQCSDV